jgi:small subunit ribosomal protein S13
VSSSEYKYILRIAGKDIDGSKKSIVALSSIRGVGYNYSQVLLQSLNSSPSIGVGYLADRVVLGFGGAGGGGWGV